MDDFGLRPGLRVLLLYSGLLEDVQPLAEKMRDTQCLVCVDNVERLSSHTGSGYDLVVSGVVPNSHIVHGSDSLAEIARVTKPGGKVIVEEPETGVRSAAKLTSALKLSGLVSITQDSDSPSPEATAGSVRMRLSATKPSYEVGSSSQLRKATKPVKPVLDATTATMWTLSANDMDDEDVDLVDSDTLLDTEDLKKPDRASLSAGSCASQKKKACKNCTCGLAEELEQKSQNSQLSSQSKSACGNCYLGDAFRCAGCPYLGMPAFKPGEKIVLDNNQLTDA